MSDKTRFPCAYPEYQEKRIDTTFWDDFTMAEAFGLPAVKDTWRRAFGKWKDNIKYLVELCAVMNHKAWAWSEDGDGEMSKYYSDRYYEARDYALAEMPEGEPPRFTDEEIAFFSWVLD